MTRSPRGPHEKTPASLCVNRQCRLDGSPGENAHTRPPAAKETEVDVGGEATPSHPAGNEAMAAEPPVGLPAREDVPVLGPPGAAFSCRPRGSAITARMRPARPPPHLGPPPSHGAPTEFAAGLGLARTHREPRHFLSRTAAAGSRRRVRTRQQVEPLDDAPGRHVHLRRAPDGDRDLSGRRAGTRTRRAGQRAALPCRCGWSPRRPSSNQGPRRGGRRGWR